MLIVGSGFLTHGLPFVAEYFMGKPGAPQWSIDFDQWAKEALDRGDLDTLFAFREKAPGMPYAHPTVEHFAPLFVTLGAAARPERHRPTGSRATPTGCRSDPSRPADGAGLSDAERRLRPFLPEERFGHEADARPQGFLAEERGAR